MKQFILFFILLFSSMLIFSQNNSVSGSVVDNYNEGLPNVNVIIKGTTNGVITDLDGVFKIENLPANQKITLQFSSFGYKTREIKIVTATKNLSVVLYEGNELLNEVEVVSKNNTFSRKKTAYVSKLPLKDIENSQVYTTVTNEILESQVVTNLDEALVNATGIAKLWEATGRTAGEGTSFYASRGFAVQPKLIDGVSGVTFSAIDPSYIERIEVIKGPAATLFGSTDTSLGGLINVVTKKPYKGFGVRGTYTVGSFGTYRASVDINTPLSNNNGPYLRVNASYLKQDSFQDAGFKETFFVAPSLSYQVNNRLNFSVGLEFSRTEQTNPSMLFLRRGAEMPSKNIEDLGVDPDKSFTSNDVTLTNPIFNARVIGDYKISDEWTSQTIFSGSYGEVYGYYQYNVDGGAAAILQLGQIVNDPQLAPLAPFLGPIVNPMLVEAGALFQQEAFTRIFDKRDGNSTNYNVQQNFTGDFKIGDLRNRLVFGVDYVSKTQKSMNKVGNPTITSTSNFPQLLGFFQNAAALPVPPQLVPVLQGVGQQIEGLYNGLPYFDAFLNAQGDVIPSTFTPNAAYSPTKGQLDAVFSQIPVRVNETKSQVLAAYLSDVLNITPALTVNLGARIDHFIQDGNTATANDDYTKTTFSPQAGVVYQPIMNKLSVFANFQTGFVNVDPVINPDGTTTTFKPEQANQFEGGVKTNVFNGRLNLGASYYHIIVNNKTTSDPNALLFPLTVDVEEVVSKGIELEMNANPIEGLNLRASYSYNDTKYTDTNSKLLGRDIVEFSGRRLESSGPQSIYNLWADYQFQSDSFLNNFGIGAGFNGASENLVMNNSVSGVFTLPSYTIYNASLYYNAENYRIGIKANNLSNERYYTGWSTVNAQAPRSFLGTISYTF